MLYVLLADLVNLFWFRGGDRVPYIGSYQHSYRSFMEDFVAGSSIGFWRHRQVCKNNYRILMPTLLSCNSTRRRYMGKDWVLADWMEEKWVIIEIHHVSILCSFKNEMTFKITIWLKFNSDQSQVKWWFQKSHHFLRNTRETFNITRKMGLCLLIDLRGVLIICFPRNLIWCNMLMCLFFIRMCKGLGLW